MKHISLTCICIIPMSLRPTTCAKTLPKFNVTYIFLLFLFRSGGSILDSVDARALTAHLLPQLPATASNVCTNDYASSPPPPSPNRNSAHASGYDARQLFSTTTCKTRPAGWVRPATRFCPARGMFLNDNGTWPAACHRPPLHYTIDGLRCLPLHRLNTNVINTVHFFRQLWIVDTD